MAQIPYDPGQNMLFIYTPHQALSEGHPCYLFDEIVEKLDFSSFPDRTRTAGEPQYDPRLMTKVLLFGYSTGVFSARKLMTACREQLPFIYLARGQAPDFRTLSTFRKNNLGFLGDAFVQVLRIAQRLGLAKLGVVATDSFKVRANAAQRKVLGEKRLRELREKIRKELSEAVLLDEREDAQFGCGTAGPQLPKELRSQARRLEQIDQALESIKETGYQKASLTDPQSSQMRNHGQVLPHYSCQVTADVEHNIIAAADVSRSPADNHQLMPQLDQTMANTAKKPEKALADNGYYTTENLVEMEKRGIEGYIPNGPQARDAKLRAQGKEAPERPFEKSKFRYDAEKDIYICPLGRELTRRGDRNAKGRAVYRGIQCKNCPRKPECAPKKASRSISHSTDEASAETMRVRMDSEQGKAVYRKRFTLEPVFAWFTWAGGFTRFRLRGKAGALTELRLLCIGHNIKQIIKYLRSLGSDGAKQRLQEAMASLFSFLQSLLPEVSAVAP
jgi:transposase